MTIRPALPADAPAVADVYLASRRRFLPYAPLAHSERQVRQWIKNVVIPGGGAKVAEREGEIVAMIAVSDGGDCRWIDHLYVQPDRVNQGIGTAILRHVLPDLQPPVRLYTFEPNTAGRRFYARQGFQEIAFGDGSQNEENCPDVLMEFRGAFADNG